MLAIQLLKQPYEINFSGNPIVYSMALAPWGFVERKQDFKIAVTIQRQVTTDIFQDIKNDIFYPDFNGKISLDISSYVSAYLEFYKIRYTQIAPLEIDGQSGNFRLKILVQKDGLQVGDTLFSPTVKIIKGGLSYEFYDYREFFEGYITNNKMPLHFNRVNEPTTFAARKYLTWLYPQLVTHTQRVRIQFFDEDPTVNPYEIFVNVPGTAQKWDLFCYDCSLKNIFLNNVIDVTLAESIELFKIKSYSVAVIDENGGIVINPTLFNIDYRGHFNNNSPLTATVERTPDVYYTSTYSRTIIYTNSIGGIDSIEVLGETEMQAEYSSSNAQVVTPPSGIRNAVLQPQITGADIQEVEKFVGSTDFIDIKKMEALRDLLLSRNIFEIKFEKLIPVTINKKTIKFYTNKDNLYSMMIEWQHAFANTFYSPGFLLAQYTTCPALDVFNVVQIAKNKLQVLWAMPQPYDLVEVLVDNGTDVKSYILDGNSGSQVVEFENPAVAPGTAAIIITARVICNADSDPVEYGPITTFNLNAFPNLSPVANPDIFSLSAGYNTPQLLPGSVLDNDYDLDNDPIQVVAIPSGNTTEGGTYSLTTDGKVTYTPPSSLFNGVDTFAYILEEVADPSSAAIGNVTINVGNIGLGNGFYAKLIVRNHVEVGSGQNLLVTETISIGFYADPAGTIPKDATGLGVTINVKNRAYRHIEGTPVFDNFVVQTYLAVGTEVQIFSGQTYRIYRVGGVLFEDWRVFTLLAGTGYIPV